MNSDCSLRDLLILCGVLQLLSACTLTLPTKSMSETPRSNAVSYQPRSSLLSVTPAAGNEQSLPVDGHLYSLAECIRVALDNNPKTKGSWQHSRSAWAGVGQARSAYLPSADVLVSAQRGVAVNLDSQVENGAANTYSAGFGVRYLLLDGGARSANLKGAEAALMEANFRHNTTLQEVALQVEEAYYQLLAAKEIQRVAEQTIHQVQYHVEVAQARHQNGLVARSDLLKAATEKADADLKLVQAKSQVRIVGGRLATIMGLRPSAAMMVGDLPEDPAPQDLGEITQLMDKAARHRPELQAALYRVRQGQAAVEVANSRYWPDVTLNTDYGWKDRSLFPDREQWALGVEVSLPLFDGFKRENTVQRAQADLAVTTADFDKLLQGVELETWTAYVQLSEATQAIAAAKTLVKSAEESARVSEGEYKNGAATIIDLTDAQTTRSTAHFRLVQAKLDYHMAMARLERAIGQSEAGKNIL